MTQDHLVIAIDGPAAAGKSTVASRVADALNALYFDTGVVYRALTLCALRQAIDLQDGERLAQLADEIKIEVRPPSEADGRQYDVLLNDEDVTWDLRSGEIDQNVSGVASFPEVRERLLDLQRRIGRSGLVVMPGRDIGTIVMPDAEIKIWLDAHPDTRARRRFDELSERDVNVTFEAVLESMIARDNADASRDVAPMKPASDAIILDTETEDIDDITGTILDIVLRYQSRGGDAANE